MCLMASAQPQAIFMSQLNALEYSHSNELKGKFIFDSPSGDAYYECTKPLLGFTTLIMQPNGTGKIIIRAVANKLAPLPPMLEKVLDQLTRVAGILDIVKKDSDTDAPLRSHLLSLPKIERIIVFADKSGAPATTFFLGKDGDYMITIVSKD